jgi:3-hydroxyacyl-CoA dehydrogenase
MRSRRFLTTTLGKGVIRAKDTPNFIANRVGVFSILATMHHAQRSGSASMRSTPHRHAHRAAQERDFRTADVVGLDTFAHVVGTMERTLPDDPWHPYLRLPAWLQADRARRAGAEDAARRLPEGRPRHPRARSGTAATGSPKGASTSAVARS